MSLGTLRIKMTVKETKSEALFDEIVNVLTAAVNKLGAGVLEKLEKITGVQHQTLKMLAIMGHPYATRNPHPPQHPGIINKQSGELAGSFHKTAARLVGNKIVSDISSSDPEKSAMLLSGTPAMIMRDYMSLIGDKYEEEIVAEVVQKLSRFLKVRVV